MLVLAVLDIAKLDEDSNGQGLLDYEQVTWGHGAGKTPERLVLVVLPVENIL